jgi:hypothetical protein
MFYQFDKQRMKMVRTFWNFLRCLQFTFTTVDRHFQTQSVMTKYKYSEQWKSSKGDKRFEYSSGTNLNSNSFCSVEKITDLLRKYCARQMYIYRLLQIICQTRPFLLKSDSKKQFLILVWNKSFRRTNCINI